MEVYKGDKISFATLAKGRWRPVPDLEHRRFQLSRNESSRRQEIEACPRRKLQRGIPFKAHLHVSPISN
jgi:hypothetical protein